MARRRERTVKQKLLDVVWGLGQLGGLVFFAWLNAANFDATELKMIAEFAVFWKVLGSIREAVS